MCLVYSNNKQIRRYLNVWDTLHNQLSLDEVLNFSTAELLYTEAAKQAKNKTLHSILDCPAQKRTETCCTHVVHNQFDHLHHLKLFTPILRWFEITECLCNHKSTILVYDLNGKGCPTCCGALRYPHVSFLF